MQAARARFDTAAVHQARVAQLVGGTALRPPAVRVRIAFRVRSTPCPVGPAQSGRRRVTAEFTGSIPVRGASCREPSERWHRGANAERGNTVAGSNPAPLPTRRSPDGRGAALISRRTRVRLSPTGRVVNGNPGKPPRSGWNRTRHIGGLPSHMPWWRCGYRTPLWTVASSGGQRALKIRPGLTPRGVRLLHPPFQAFVAQRKSNRLLSGGSGYRNSPKAQRAVRALDALVGLLSPVRRVRFPGTAYLPLAQRTEQPFPRRRVPVRILGGRHHAPLAQSGRAAAF